MRVGPDAVRVSIEAGDRETLRVIDEFDDDATRDCEARADRRRTEVEPVAIDRRGPASATRASAAAPVFDGAAIRGAGGAGDVATGTGDVIGAAASSGSELAVSKLLERLSRLADMTSRTSVLSSASTSATGFESSEQAARVAVTLKAKANVRRAVFIRGSVRRRV